MKTENYNKLMEVWAYCDRKDKSTEFMLTYMADLIPDWDESDAADWLIDNSNKRGDWYKKNPNWIEKYF